MPPEQILITRTHVQDWQSASLDLGNEVALHEHQAEAELLDTAAWYCNLLLIWLSPGVSR